MYINLKKLSFAFLLTSSFLTHTVYGGVIGKFDDPENKKTPAQRLQVLIEDPKQIQTVDTLIKSNDIREITNFVNKYWQEFYDRVSARKALNHLEELLNGDSFSFSFFAARALKEIMNERTSLMNHLYEKAGTEAEKREFLLKAMEYKGKAGQYLDRENKAQKVILQNTMTLMRATSYGQFLEAVKREERLQEWN